MKKALTDYLFLKLEIRSNKPKCLFISNFIRKPLLESVKNKQLYVIGFVEWFAKKRVVRLKPILCPLLGINPLQSPISSRFSSFFHPFWYFWR